MLNPPPLEVLDRLPRLYANKNARTSIPDIIIHLHFFCVFCNWWITEFDGEDIFWGFVNLGDDMCAEWGYVPFSKLKRISENGIFVPIIDTKTGQVLDRLALFVEWDEYWKPKPFREIQWRRRQGQ